jgi:NAD(P)-dependent dehydrogenase (short-subunit alcohol dehydrogenase family)
VRTPTCGCGGAEDRTRSERSKRHSKDGFDCRMQGNVISHYLLTQLLMPALKVGAHLSGKSRIVNCTSGGLEMLRTKIDEDAFEQAVVFDGDKKPYSMHNVRLNQSKKAMVALTLGLRVCFPCVHCFASNPSLLHCSCPATMPTDANFPKAVQCMMRCATFHSVSCTRMRVLGGHVTCLN